MRHFIRIAIWFYLLIILVFGFSALLVLARVTEYSTAEHLLRYLATDPKASMIAGLVTGIVMVTSTVIAGIIWGRQAQERSIFIDNPLGRVTISLSALEDLVRRMVVRSPQIKEIRPDIISSRKGLKVDIRLVLHSDVNIPRLTGELQEMIQRKICDVIGKEERIVIRIHVIKISGDSLSSRKGRDNDDDDVPESPVHYHGYRA